MCNIRIEGTDSLRERIGYDYGEGPEVPPYWDNYGGGIPESVPIFPDSDYNMPEPPFRVPVLRPGGNQPQPLDPYTGRGKCKPKALAKVLAEDVNSSFRSKQLRFTN